MDISLFFERYEESAAVQLQVDNICSGCPVRVQCREWADEVGFEGGVAGRKYYGQSAKARKRRRSERVRTQRS